MVICTVKPLAIDVWVPSVGVSAESNEIFVTVALPELTASELVVVIVAVELVLAATPVMVTKPILLIVTVPDAVAVPAHV